MSHGMPRKVVFAYIDEPPFAQPRPGAEPVGCDVDLVRTILAAIGVQEVEMRLTTFAELLPGVAAGRWTINTPLFVTPERAASVAFSRPVWALNDGLVVRAEDAHRLNGYRAIALDPSARLGVVGGQVQRDTALKAGVPPERISEFATQPDALAAVLAGRVDAYASTAIGNRTVVRALGSPALAVVDAAEVQARAPVGAYSFARESVALRDRFDEALARYLGSPGHRAMMAAHGLSDREIDPVVKRG